MTGTSNYTNIIFIDHLYKELTSLPEKERPLVGKKINELKIWLTKKLHSNNVILEDDFNSDGHTDYTLSGTPIKVGSKHPLSLVLEEIKIIFSKIGFSTVLGPEVDTDFFNFEALNIPKDHPARDMQDTFYIEDGVVLRTHTSNSQIHTMLKHSPPIKIIAPGRVYRNEDISVRSYCLFQHVNKNKSRLYRSPPKPWSCSITLGAA